MAIFCVHVVEQYFTYQEMLKPTAMPKESVKDYNVGFELTCLKSKLQTEEFHEKFWFPQSDTWAFET